MIVRDCSGHSCGSIFSLRVSGFRRWGKLQQRRQPQRWRRRINVSSEAQWLTKRLEVVGYFIIVVLASFVSQGGMRSCSFA